MGGVFIWDIQRTKQITQEMAVAQARANYNKDVAFRFWATGHGLIYVPVTAKNLPDPNLAHLPERDIQTQSGQKLTLMNPARMVRELNSDYGELFGAEARITSLRPLWAGNLPDNWERNAIRQFEAGVKEVQEFTDIGGEPYLRLMQPLMISQGCLLCHSRQGFKVGDVSGGIGVSIPMNPLFVNQSKRISADGLALGLVWMIGILALLVAHRGLARGQLERQKAHNALMASEVRKSAIMESALDCIITMDHQGKIQEFNPSAEQVFGYQRNQVIGKDLAELVIPQSLRSLHNEGIKNHLMTGEQRLLGNRIETMAQRSDGSEFPVELAITRIDIDGNPLFTAYIRDMTEARELEEKLTFQATHDALTGLINRQEFERRLENLLEDPAYSDGEHALLYLDLDQFKVINDTCGPAGADELLCRLGDLLQARMRAGDTLARLGGDEFGVLLTHCPADKATMVAEEILEAVHGYRFSWKGLSLTIGVSIGLVPVHPGGQSMGDVMSVADAACYIAKEGGRNRLHVFRTDDVEFARRKGEIRWVSRIHDAFQDGRFSLHQQRLQPLNKAASAGGNIHYEILIRMQDENGEFVPPGIFLSAAERYGLMPTIDRWVVRTAFAWLSDHPAHLEQLEMCSINLSGLSVTDNAFRDFIIDQFAHFRIPPERICFEITETAVVSSLGKAVRFIEALRGLGCRFALDDFGTGMSSFAYLKSLPVDYLKIDGTFVRDILEDKIDFAMVRSINEIGHVMGKRTIAEFVENERILQWMTEIGVDYAQGYGVARPAPLDQLPGGLSQGEIKNTG